MKVLILTDAGKYGLGHFSRMLTLYEELTYRNIENIRFLVDTTENINFKYAIKKKWLNEYSFLKSLKADIIVVDSYRPSKKFLKFLTKISKLTVFFDDVKRISYPRGIIVNFSLVTDILFKHKNKDNIYLLGHRFIPINDTFKTVKRKFIKKEKKKILVVMKGVSDKNVYAYIINNLKKEFRNKDIIFINDNNTVSKENLAKLMVESYFAISTAGMTLHELVYMGVPTIPILVASNQSEGYSRYGVVDYYININNKDWKTKFTNYLSNIKNNYELYLKKAKIGENLVDGKGVERIVDKILEAYTYSL